MGSSPCIWTNRPSWRPHDGARLAPKAMATKLVRVLRLQHPDYHYLKKVFQYTREILELGPPPPRQRLPALLTAAA